MNTLCVTSASVVLLTLASIGASAADVREGEMLAKQWCASCHVIGADQTSGVDHAPAFASIAAETTDHQKELRAWLADPHPPMPNLSLTRYEIDNLIAYIESLSAE